MEAAAKLVNEMSSGAMLSIRTVADDAVREVVRAAGRRGAGASPAEARLWEEETG
jgi:hypothetical protein